MKEFMIRSLLALGVLTGWSVLGAPTPLESAVLTAVRAQHFEQVIDFGAGNEEHPVSALQHRPAAPVAHLPNVDVAVIQLDAAGRAVAWADVLLSRDYPQGLVVPVDLSAGAASVRFRRWDIERADGGTFSRTGARLSTKGWTNDPPLTADDDIVPGRAQAPYQFMAPYPASLFKLMVAFHVMRMVDLGRITLDTTNIYAVAVAAPEPRKVRDWLEPMITVSDNHATGALLKMLHDRHEIEPLNVEFRELGLGTLQINHTSAADGLGWQPGQIHMTAFDVARLLWLIDGGPGELWQSPEGQQVAAGFLSDSSRAYLKQLLGDQGFNEGLSTANYPTAPNVQAGLPSRVAARWINAANGHVVVEGADYGVDIRALNERAEVTFAHKTGLTFNYGSDAGIVTSLPGKPFRHYVIAFLGNLGYRYADGVFAGRTNFPANDRVSPVAYTRRIPALGRAIDAAVTQLSH